MLNTYVYVACVNECHISSMSSNGEPMKLYPPFCPFCVEWFYFGLRLTPGTREQEECRELENNTCRWKDIHCIYMCCRKKTCTYTVRIMAVLNHSLISIISHYSCALYNDFPYQEQYTMACYCCNESTSSLSVQTVLSASAAHYTRVHVYMYVHVHVYFLLLSTHIIDSTFLQE